MRRLLILFIIFVCIGCGPSFAMQNGANDEYNERKSMHFIVYHDKSVDRSFINKLISKSEEAYKSIANDLHFFRDEPWVFDHRAIIYVYKDKQEYLAKTGMPAWSYGAASPHKKEVYTFDGAWQVFKYVLMHELTHLIFREYVGLRADVPLWLDEAAAVYMEQKSYRSQRAARVKDLLKNNYIPIGKLFSQSHQSLHTTPGIDGSLQGNDFVEAFYLESFSVLYFLIKRWDRFKFNMLCKKLRKGVPFEKAFFDTYRMVKDYNHLEKKWKEYYLGRK